MKKAQLKEIMDRLTVKKGEIQGIDQAIEDIMSLQPKAKKRKEGDPLPHQSIGSGPYNQKVGRR